MCIYIYPKICGHTTVIYKCVSYILGQLVKTCFVILLYASSVEDIWDFIWKIMLQTVPMVLLTSSRNLYHKLC